VLGEPGWQDNGYVGWQAGSATLMIGPHSEVKGRNEMPGRIIVNFETPDVQGEFDRIKGLGTRVEHEPYQPGDGAEMWLATFEDPEEPPGQHPIGRPTLDRVEHGRGDPPRPFPRAERSRAVSAPGSAPR